MAWSDCRPTTLQLASYTHRHSHTQALATLSATTQLATVCVLPSSLLQASRSALRQGKPTHTLSRTHTHTHTPRCSTPIFFFGREEMRREQRQGGVALFASSHSCRAAVKSGRPQISQGFRCSVLKVVSKRFGAPSLKRGNMQQIGKPEPGETHKILGSRKRDLDLCGGFWKRANFFFGFVFFSGWKNEGGSHARGSPLLLLENSFAASDPMGSDGLCRLSARVPTSTVVFDAGRSRPRI